LVRLQYVKRSNTSIIIGRGANFQTFEKRKEGGGRGDPEQKGASPERMRESAEQMMKIAGQKQRFAEQKQRITE